MKEGWLKSSSNNCDPFLIACVSIFLSVATEFFPTNRTTFLDANTIVKSDFPYQFDLLSFSSQGNGFDIDHVSCQQRAHHVSPFVRKKIILCLSNKILKSQFLMIFKAINMKYSKTIFAKDKVLHLYTV